MSGGAGTSVQRPTSKRPFPPPPRLASTTAMDLADVPNDAMLREMQRRLDCLTRPEKRVILVGAQALGAQRARRLSVCNSITTSGVASCRSRLAPRAGPPGCGKGTQSPKIKARRPQTRRPLRLCAHDRGSVALTSCATRPGARRRSTACVTSQPVTCCVRL